MQSASDEESRRGLAVVILAAGLGTRMKSKTAKVLHAVCGKPMIGWVTEAAQALGAGRLLIVLAPDTADEVHPVLPQHAEVVIQEEQLGTGDALRAAEEQLAGFEGDILVMYGDTPLIRAGTLEQLAFAHERQRPACTLMTVKVDDPSHYGRVLRDADDRVTSIVEDRDCSAAEKEINEVNSGFYVFESASLWPALAEVTSENAQGEVYLTDVIAILAGKNREVIAWQAPDAGEIVGVNSRLDLSRATAAMRERILEQHMLDGVTVIDPATTYIDAGVMIGRDTTLEPMTMLAGETVIGEDCRIGPSTTLVDTAVDDGASVVASHVTGARIATGCQVGPYAFLRPGAVLEPGAKAGTFVEIKKSRIGAGSKVPHLSYVGDTDIGEDTNVAAGNITANYDGIGKHRTEIGSHVHTGADTVFVAPVKVGDNAMTGAGSVITDDVPEGALGIGRARQKNIEGYARRKFGRSGESGAAGDKEGGTEGGAKGRKG